MTQFLRRVIRLNRLRHNRAGGVTFGEVLGFSLYDAGDVAARQCNATHAE